MHNRTNYPMRRHTIERVVPNWIIDTMMSRVSRPWQSITLPVTSAALTQSSPMRRKYDSPASPLLYFRDDILSVPGYTFERVIPIPTPSMVVNVAHRRHRLPSGTTPAARPSSRKGLVLRTGLGYWPRLPQRIVMDRCAWRGRLTCGCPSRPQSQVS